MTRSITSLTWADQSKADEPIAPYTVNYALDQTWQFTLPGTYHLNAVSPVGMIVDNSAFPGTTTVTIGSYQMTVLPFTRQPIDFSADAQQVTLTGSNATDQPRIQFYLKKPIDLVQNQFAIYQAVQQQIAANFLGSMQPIINSEMKLWPDGNSRPSTALGTYTAEGWMLGGSAGNWTATRQIGIVTNAQASLDVQRTAGSGDVSAMGLATALQSEDTNQFKGVKVTVSFDIYFGSTFSNPAGVFVALVGGPGPDQTPLIGALPGFTGVTVIKQIQVAPNVAVQRLSFTTDQPIAQIFFQLGFWIFWQPIGVAGVNDFFGISRVQFDIGETAQAYRTVPDAFERDRCARFYEIINGEQQPGANFTMTSMFSATFTYAVLTFKTKRAIPTFTWLGGNLTATGPGIGTITSNAIAAGGNISLDRVRLEISFAGGGGANVSALIQAAAATTRFALNARM